MIIKTSYFGEIPINNCDILNFENGLLGFEDYHEFALLKFDENDNSILCLQSLDNELISFILLDPSDFIDNYQVVVSKEDMDLIKAVEEEIILAYIIAVIPNDYKKITVNTKSPIIINSKNNKATQIFIDNPDYSFRHNLYSDSEVSNA